MATKSCNSTVRSLLRPSHASFLTHSPKSTARSRTCRSPRSYHSTTHPAPASPYNPTESRILTAATQHVPAHGFTLEALALGAKEAGYLDASTNLFPRGEFELVMFWLWTQRTGLGGKCERAFGREGGKLGVGSKVKLLTWERLIANAAIVGRWQEALSLMAVPAHIPASLRELALLSDEIFFLSSDASVDSSWYTKRASLSSIYASSELFMTTDRSTDFKDTREFMDRRFGDVQTIGGTVGGLGQWVGFQARAAVNVGRSWGVRI